MPKEVIEDRKDCEELCAENRWCRGYEFRVYDMRCELHSKKIDGLLRDENYGCYRKIAEVDGDWCFKRVNNDDGDTGFCRARGGEEFRVYEEALSEKQCMNECLSETGCKGFEWGFDSKRCEIHTKKPSYIQKIQGYSAACYKKVGFDSCAKGRLLSGGEPAKLSKIEVPVKLESTNLRQG